MADHGKTQYRRARPADAAAVAALHADSWRRHYRGAYSDEFLDGDVLADRTAVWAERLSQPTDRDHTLLAEQHGVLIGFVHTILDEDPLWGSLLDNLHVAAAHERRGIGSRLLRSSAAIVAEQRPGSGLYLWVLEQNLRAQAFYQALGGARVERGVVPPPGDVPGRINGAPGCFRYAWPDPCLLVRS